MNQLSPPFGPILLFLILTFSVTQPLAKEQKLRAGSAMEWIKQLEIGQVPASLRARVHTTTVNSQRLFIATDREAGSDLVAEWLIRLLAERTRSDQWTVLGLATGSTPTGVYNRLTAAFSQGRFTASRLKTFNLDEYLGLPPEHPASYAYFMAKHLFNEIGIISGQVNIPDGLSGTPNQEALRYQHLLDETPRDIQLLGIGRNGHIGFNEPGSGQYTRTRVIDLSASTRKTNSQYFDRLDSIPEQAITMGIADILESRVNILMAWGEHKAATVYQAITGKVCSSIPASYLQNHPNTFWVMDKSAASQLLVD